MRDFFTIEEAPYKQKRSNSTLVKFTLAMLLAQFLL